MQTHPRPPRRPPPTAPATPAPAPSVAQARQTLITQINFVGKHANAAELAHLSSALQCIANTRDANA